MDDAAQAPLLGRAAELKRFRDHLRQSARANASYLWISGEPGCGKSHFLDACAERAAQAGWEVLRGYCTEETRSDPYGPFLSMLGLCFDRSGRLINDRSVYSIVDQISLDDVFDAVADIPGMSVVAFGIKVGMTIFESRRRPKADDELLNRSFEVILQVLRQIDQKRGKPVLLALDDLHLASTTTYALIEYLLTRIQDTRLLVAATWQADSAENAHELILKGLRNQARTDRILHLSPLSDDETRLLLHKLGVGSLPDPLASTLIEFSRGLPSLLVESIRLIGLEGQSGIDATRDLETADSVLQTLIARQLAQVTGSQRALLDCMALIGNQIPLDLATAAPLSAYMGISEREILAMVVELADQEVLLTWDGPDAVRFASPFVHRFLRSHAKSPIARRDHLRIAESWQAVSGESRPAKLAMHYLASGDVEKAFAFAKRSAEELNRSAAYPEAVQSYRLALEALEQFSNRQEREDAKYDVLRAMSLAAEQAGDWDEALARLEEALILSEGDLSQPADPERQADIYAGLGWLRFQRGEVQTALRHLNHSADLYKLLEDVPGQAQIDYYLGVLYSRQKEWQRAIECFERYLDTCEQQGISEGQASAYTELGNLYRQKHQWSRAESLLQQGIDLAHSERDYAVLAQGYHYLGLCYSWQGNPESADVLYRALDIVRTRTKQPAQEARIHNTLAETLVRMSRWHEAEDAFRASAKIKERLGDKAGLAMTYGGLGRLYFRQWRFDLAAEYLQKDIDLLAEEFDANVSWIQQLTNTIGEVRRLQGQLDQAAVCFTKALSLLEQIPDQSVRKQSQGYTHMLMARLALDRGDLTAAQKACKIALQRLTGTWADGEVQRTAARLARMRGNMEEAGQHLEKALAAAERGEDLDRALAYLEQAHFHQDAGQAEQVRNWAQRVIALAQRLQNRELESLASQLAKAV